MAEISRRSLCQAATAILGGLVAASGRAARCEAAAAAKIAKAAAKYQDTPQGSERCALCVQFLPPSACKLVAGRISPQGWCELFSPKPPS